ncbi:DUF6891 domain-containing protein [Nocardiopsis valliformis]|uniref:DUF6891 domain-containing protein n=1 Tax=Nocardiopsis valliformis TaxID=239974 RepID=UPI00034DF335|nr:hypothetical protein [Nocardiopsis valliformis]
MDNPFPNADADKILGETWANLCAQVVLGVLGFDEIVDRRIDDLILDGLAEYVENPELLPTDDPHLQRDWMVALLDAEFASALRRQETAEMEEGGSVLDSERLTAAFADLDAAGILARENYACCNSCATAELAGEAEQLRGERARGGLPPVRGYVYYHRQDAERLAPFLGFGSYVEDSPAEHAAVGREIVEALRCHGLAPGWGGDPNQKIEGPSLARRRTGALAWHPSAAG